MTQENSAKTANLSPEALSNLQNSFLVIARVCFLSFTLLGLTIYSELDPLINLILSKDIFLLIAIVFGINAVIGFWIASIKTGKVFSLFQLILDSILVSLLILITNGASSPFIFLYLPIGMAAAAILNIHSSILISQLCFAEYLLVLFLLKYSKYPYLTELGGIQEPVQGLFFQFIGLCSALLLTPIATSYLITRLKKNFMAIEVAKENLLSLSKRQGELINILPDGIISVDRNNNILGFNQQAANFFQLSKEIIGENLTSIIPNFNVHHAINFLNIKDYSCTIISTNNKFLCSSYTNENDPSEIVYIFKDITDFEATKEKLALQNQLADLSKQRKSNLLNISDGYSSNIIGKSTKIIDVIQLIEKVAPTDANILITGESGTGKELVAQAIHQVSERKNHNFIALNCGAIPEGLIESELFGHIKGSFTGADSNKLGILRAAKGGTVFLDEIGELPIALQPKLLRALQEKKVRPVGSEEEISFEARIVSATNRNLTDFITQEKFREDLYYRINVVNITLPALREHKEDLPLLIDHILAKRLGKATSAVVLPEAMQFIINYDYPGNIRELENIIERALILGGNVILPENLPLNMREHVSTNQNQETKILFSNDVSFPVNLDQILNSLEKNYLTTALEKAQGSKSKAASLLGINFRSMRYRLRKFKLIEEDLQDNI